VHDLEVINVSVLSCCYKEYKMAPSQQQAELELWNAERHSPFQCKEIMSKFREPISHACMRASACVCVCVWERERERERQKCRMHWPCISGYQWCTEFYLHTKCRLSRRWNQAIRHTDGTLLLIYYINTDPGYIPNILFSDNTISPLWEKYGS